MAIFDNALRKYKKKSSMPNFGNLSHYFCFEKNKEQ